MADVTSKSSKARREQLAHARTFIRADGSQRTKVHNGNKPWGDVDGRSLWARRASELLAAHIADLGGSDNISKGEYALAKRCAVLITELERREAEFAKAGKVTDEALAIYQTTVSTLRRVLQAIGLPRRARNVTPPNIHDYLKKVAKLEVVE